MPLRVFNSEQAYPTKQNTLVCVLLYFDAITALYGNVHRQPSLRARVKLLWAR